MAGSLSNRLLRVVILGSALHFGPHNGAESYRQIVWHTDQNRRKRLHIMSGFPLIFLIAYPLARGSNIPKGFLGPAPNLRRRMLIP